MKLPIDENKPYEIYVNGRRIKTARERIEEARQELGDHALFYKITSDQIMLRAMGPHAERGIKVLRGAKRAGRIKNLIHAETKKVCRREADKRRKKNPHLSNKKIGIDLAKEINRLIDLAEKGIEEESSPLNEISKLRFEEFSKEKRKVKPDTIRKII